jgi:hypothetical protein
MPSSPGSIPAIELPTGGELVGFNNPNPPTSECSAIINLQTQVAPLIASMTCQLKVLRLLQPLIEVIKGLPSPSVQALESFSQAAAALAPCFVIPTPASVLPFAKNVLCMEIKSLKCLLHNLQAVTRGSGSHHASPTVSKVRGILDSYPPIVGTLQLAEELFQIAGVTLPDTPVLGNGTDAGSLKTDQDTILGFATELESIAEALGGCA